MYKKVLILAAAFCLAVSGLTSCKKSNIEDNSKAGKDNSSTTAETADTDTSSVDEAVTSVPATDADGNKITIVNVTDAQGAAVTDDKGKEVTQAVIVDKSNDIITEPDGKPAKPNLPASENDKVTTAASDNASPSTEQAGGNDAEQDKTDPAYSFKAIVWLNDYSKGTDGNGKANEVTDNGELITMTFKIKDNAANGDYEITLKNPQDGTSPYGTFCNGDMTTPKELNMSCTSGVISVGTKDAKKQGDPSGSTGIVFSNAAGNPGDTVTVTTQLTGNTGLFAFNTWVHYNSDVLDLTNISAGSIIAGKGDFLTG